MSTIANLDVNLVAHTKKFDSRIKKSGKGFGSFASKIGKFAGGPFVAGVGLMVGAVGGLLAVRSAMKNVNEQFTKIDHLTKFADEVGTSVSQLQALELQAELTGTSSATLEKGVGRFNRILGDARAGNSTAIKSFDQLGLSTASFDGLSLTEQIGVVSDAINSGETAADRASNAYAVFGRSGQELLTFFDGGSEGIAAAAADIERFGGGLSRLDGAQVEIMNDAFSRLHTMMEMIWQNIAVKVAPIMTALVEMFIDGAVEADGFGGVIETGFGILVAGIGFAMDGFNVFMGFVEGARAIWTANLALVLNVFAQIERALVSFGGKSFDFGIAGLADAAEEVALDYANKAGQRFNDGFNGVASKQFEAKLAEIKNRAKTIADDKALQPPVIADPKSVDWAQLGSDFLSDMDKELRSQHELFTGFGNFGDPESAAKDAPSVAALTKGSAAAASAVNAARSGREKGVEGAIKKSHKESIKVLEKQDVNLGKIFAQMKKGAGVIVGI